MIFLIVLLFENDYYQQLNDVAKIDQSSKGCTPDSLARNHWLPFLAKASQAVEPLRSLSQRSIPQPQNDHFVTFNVSFAGEY